jgi:hypothetical protein
LWHKHQKEKRTSDTYNMDEHQNNYAKSKNPDSKNSILYDSVHKKLWKRTKWRVERNQWFLGAGAGESVDDEKGLENPFRW